jgi:hypothetical protein
MSLTVGCDFGPLAIALLARREDMFFRRAVMDMLEFAA